MSRAGSDRPPPRALYDSTSWHAVVPTPLTTGGASLYTTGKESCYVRPRHAPALPKTAQLEPTQLIPAGPAPRPCRGNRSSTRCLPVRNAGRCRPLVGKKARTRCPMMSGISDKHSMHLLAGGRPSPAAAPRLCRCVSCLTIWPDWTRSPVCCCRLHAGKYTVSPAVICACPAERSLTRARNNSHCSHGTTTVSVTCAP